VLYCNVVCWIRERERESERETEREGIIPDTSPVLGLLSVGTQANFVFEIFIVPQYCRTYPLF